MATDGGMLGQSQTDQEEQQQQREVKEKLLQAMRDLFWGLVQPGDYPQPSSDYYHAEDLLESVISSMQCEGILKWARPS